jgi:pimeloyl-ACP methyl ester carboxylesterase
MGPRFLYLHGFGSGRDSAKGVALEAHYAARGVALERLDLRVPSLEHLRLSAMIATTRAAIGDASDRAVIFGSSLGGLTAARVAAEDARVCALVLLAPAFGMASHYRARIGDAAWNEWQATDRLEIDDYALQRKTTLDFGFAEDLLAIDAARGEIPDVRVPTLIVHGRADSVVPIEGSRAYAAQRRWVRLVEVDDEHELTRSVARIAAEADDFLRAYFCAG